jgi:hypothetical protein
MTVGYVLISCDVGYEKQVLRKLVSINQVTRVDQLLGMYEFIAEINCDSAKKFRETISWRFHKIQKIRSIVSLLGKP